MNLHIKGCRLIDFRSLNDAQKRLVLEWRNHDAVRTCMLSQKIISYEEHMLYLESLWHMKDKLCYLVQKQNRGIGVIEFGNITKESAQIGLSKNPHIKGVGNLLMSLIESVACEKLHLQELQLEVLERNKHALHLYEKWGYSVTSNQEHLICMEKKLCC
ncbi:MAG: UDP-4-amino-4,6-dideoxy-N-acetyl-beta-L-altrosamine N-acetyltransferase [Epsilonproteobacteria bacterium]|nr:UDP-4-amino-4,6-dideoxy-N-acetyl-beta-L-altrosamine N-acetyltransferase [Campylobacterota bacterium]